MGLIIFLVGAETSLTIYLRLQPRVATAQIALREGGYRLINPLLLCNVNDEGNSPGTNVLSSKLRGLVVEEVAAKRIISASIYFRDIISGSWINVNDTETFFPSSLGKVPILMTYLEFGEQNPQLLNSRLTYTGLNQNKLQEIQPRNPVRSGQAYTVQELLRSMITASDNNASAVLYDHLDKNILNQTYELLGIKLPININNGNNTRDFLTARDYAHFFRVLYSATYISSEESEAALEMLADSEFVDGLVAGVPKNITVAHKFGTYGNILGGVVIDRELHDCGIVYAPGHPYVLCIMTKGTNTLANQEQTIQNISRAVYAEIAKPSQ